LRVEVPARHEAPVVDIERQGRGRARDVDGGQPAGGAAQEAVPRDAIGVDVAADDVTTVIVADM
jgi:hypothetical protein